MEFHFGCKERYVINIVSKKLGLEIHLMLCHLISMLITRPLTYWPTEGKNHGWFICVCVIGLAADPSLAIAQFPPHRTWMTSLQLTSGQLCLCRLREKEVAVGELDWGGDPSTTRWTPSCIWWPCIVGPFVRIFSFNEVTTESGPLLDINDAVRSKAVMRVEVIHNYI